MSQTTGQKDETTPYLVGLEEQPGALSEGWALFLQGIQSLAAESRRRAARQEQEQINRPSSGTNAAGA